MTTIVTRAGKGSALTHTELDNNFTNLNTDKVEASGDSMTGNLSFGDNNKAVFGAGSDLQIYHDGSNSYIDEVGTGTLRVRGHNQIRVTNTADSIAAIFKGDAEQTLYYNNADKLATTSTGIDVTGTVTADGLTVDGDQRTNGDITINYGGQTINAGGGVFAGQTPSIDVRSDASFGAPYAELITIRGATATADLISRTVGLSLKTSSENTTNETAKGYDIYANSQLTYGNDPDFYIDRSNGAHRLKISANGDISFYEDTGTTAKFFWDASAESLGIGGTPFAQLDVVKGTGAATINPAVIRITSTTAASDWDLTSPWGSLEFYSYDSSGDGSGVKAQIGAIMENTVGGNVGLGFYTENGTVGLTEKVRIDSVGNVGIGTTNPAQALDVDGNVHLASGGGSLIIGGTGAAIVDLERDTSNYIRANKTTSSNLVIGTGADLRFCTGQADGDFAQNERMRIDSSGNLLVGKTGSNIATEGAQFGGGQHYLTTSGDAPIKLNRLTSDGVIAQFRKDSTTVGSIGSYLGDSYVGTGVAGLRFYDAGPAVSPHNTTTNVGTNGTTDLGTSAGRFKDLYLSGGLRGDTLTFSSLAGTERARIDSSGNLLVGTTSLPTDDNSSLRFGVSSSGEVRAAVNNGKAAMFKRASSDGDVVEFRKDSFLVGSISVTASATAYNTSSDYRLKENVVSMDNASDRVLALNPCRFNFVADPDKTVDGFLAHEAQEVVPEAVTGSKDAMRTEEYEVSPAVLDEDGNVVTEAVMGTREVPDYQGIDQSKLVPLLTKALQEALERIAVLESKVGA